jgi:drug/metabolite transporter superfamily protein YnfA
MSESKVKKKPIGKMLVMGVISLALYALLLLKQDVIIGYIGQGGLYAILPIITAFIFSYVHGSFTGDFWTVMGIEAAKKKKEVK